MRYVCAPAGAMVLLASFAALVTFGQGPSGTLTISNFQLVAEQRQSPTESYFTYRPELLNTGAARTAVTGTVTSLDSAIRLVDPVTGDLLAQANLHFAPVPAGGRVMSSDTFTILANRTVPLDFTRLAWSFVAPVANAGPNQTAAIGTTVTLNGSASSNPSGIGTLAYNWTFVTRPPGTATRLLNASDAMPTFLVDVPGTYIVKLTVSNGAGTDTATVAVSTTNSPPIANAGPNQTVAPGATVILNGSLSSDVDGDPLTYTWTLIARPAGSTAVLQGANSVSPTFVADRPGTYIAQLVVSDGKLNSSPATVWITTQNTPPVANAGANQTVSVGAQVTLNGSASTDVDGDPLTYQWSLITVPSGSTATLSNPTLVDPVFTADKSGIYVAQLIVSDGKVNSAPATVTITTGTVQAPVANAGPNQTVKHGTLVTLSGSGTDPQSRPLTFQWALITRPAGSTAVLSSLTAQNPTFTADLPGTYVAQLIVNNGTVNSAPATVTITTTNTAPVANAGSAQNVSVGSIVFLNGNGSSDADGDPLTYSWSLTSVPAGSSAALSAANSATPTFLADVAGSYVAQLIVRDAFASSNPVTVTIVASHATITLTPDPLNLSLAPGTLTVGIGTPAGPGGLVVRLVALDPSVAQIPESATIPQNANSAQVTVTPGSFGSTIVIASVAGYRPGIATINVGQASLGLQLSASTVGLTRTINGTVSLSTPAPAPGVVVTLSSAPSGIVTLQPVSVNVPTGSSSASFTVTGAAVGSALIAASASGYAGASAPVTVSRLGQISVQGNTVVAPGQSVPLQVTLTTAAPQGGVSITLDSSNPSVATIAPSMISIPQGAISPSTPPQVTGVALGTATISASAPGFTGDAQNVTVSATLGFQPSSVSMGSGATRNLTLTLSGPAPAGGLSVNLQSSNPGVASVPALVTIPQGGSSAVVQVSGAGTGTVTITATAAVPNVSPATATVTVFVLGTVVLPSGLSVGLGQTVPFPIALSSPAPEGGVIVTLVNRDPSRITLSATSIPIVAGSTTPESQPQVTAIGLGPATVNATAPGYGTAAQIVLATASLSFSPPTLAITGVATQNLTLTLSAPAPSGGLLVALSSDDPAVATVPVGVTIAQNTTTATVPVTGAGPGSTTVRATATGTSSATAGVTVQPIGGILLPSGVTISVGQTVPFPVTLPNPAPANVTVALASNDATRVTISMSSVAITAGQTQPAQQPTVTGVNYGSASIIASAPGYTTSIQPVQVGGALSFASQNISVPAGTSQMVALNFSGSAPAGGLVVNLSSSAPAAASVPASITIPAGANSALVPVSGLTAGSAIISATSSAANVTGATTNVSVQSLGGIGLPAGLTLALGQTVALPITLPAPAPAGGTTVTLSSSDLARVTVSPATVTIPAGLTQPPQQPQVAGVGPGQATVSASAPGFTSANVPVTVTGTMGLAPQNLSITGTATRDLTLTISGPAPAGGLAVNLASSATNVAAVRTTVTIAQGATSAPVPVTGVAPGTATITASAPGLGQATANVTVVQPVDILLPADLTLAPGESALFPVILANPAATPTFVALSSGDETKVTLSVGSVFINAGQTQPAAQPRVYAIAAGSATITASAAGLAPATSTVTVGVAMSFSPSALTITGTATQNLTLVLTAPAPAGGVPVNLVSSATGVATVPASVTVPAGSASVAIPVTGVAPGASAITASAAGINPATATVTVVAPGTISIPALTNVQLGATAPFSITLSPAAPVGGVTVTLSSSDQSKVTTSPASVFIPGGQTQPATQPVVNGINVGGANITVSALGYTMASGNVQVSATVRWLEQNVVIPQGTTRNLSLALSASAPWGDGLTVNLSSSNPGVASLQSSVNFFPDGSEFTTVIIPVTGGTPGTAILRASGINIPEAAITVTVAAPLSITTNALADGVVGTPYSQPLSATGGNPPYTWVLIAGALPAGLSLNSTSGILSGTPGAAVAGTPLSFRVTDSSPAPLTATRDFTLTIAAQVPSSVTATGGTPQTAPINTAFSSPLVVTVRDTSNNPVPGVQVTFNVPASGASATFAGGVNTAVTNSSGVATSPGIAANSTAGSYSVIASVPGTASTASFALTNTVGPPASITATSGTPQSTVISTAFGAPLRATVHDAGGNVVPGVTVTFTAPNSGASGSFAGGANTAVTDANGVATSNPFTANANAGSYVVAASVPGVAAPANFALTNTAGAPASIAATAGTPQSAGLGAPFAIPLSATVRDAGGNPVAGAVVTFTAPASGASGTFAGGINTATTNSSGVATAPTFTANSTAGNYSVFASVAGVSTPATFTLTNLAGSPASIAVGGGSPQSATVRTAFASRLTAVVRDSGSNPVEGVTVTFSAPATGPSGTFAGGVNTAQTNASGVAVSEVFTANAVAGSYIVSASAPGVASPVSFALTNTPGPAASIAAGSGTPQSASINSPFAAPLVAVVRDADGNAVSGVTVTFSAPASGPSARFAGGVNTAITDNAGRATSAVVSANESAGSYVVSAVAAGVAAPASFALTNTAGNPASIDATGGTPQSAAVGANFAAPLVATVRDGGGNPVAGATVTFTAPATGPSGTFAGGVNTATTNASGVATSAVFRANGTVGSYTVIASVAGVGTPATFALTNTTGSPAQIEAFSGTPQSANTGTAFGAPLAARVRDASGNPVQGVTVTFTAPATGASGTFAGGVNTALTDSQGIATAPVFTANGTAGSYSVVASVAGLGPTASFSLTNTPRPASIVAISGGDQTTLINTPFAALLVAQVRDSGGNPISGVAVTFNAPPSGASATFNGLNMVVTNAQGLATSPPVIANDVAGTYNVSAFVVGVIAPAQFTLTNSATPPPPPISISNAAVGQNLQTPLTVSLPQPAPPGGVRVDIASSNASLVRLAGRPGDPGVAAITVTIGEGLTTVTGIFVHGLAASGSAQVTATAAGFSPGSATITLARSGFVLAGPNGIGAGFSLGEGASTQLTVSAARLDSSSRFVEVQQVRGGTSVTVPLSNSTPASGSVAASVVFNGGDSSISTLFSALSPGTTTIGAGVPPGFILPSQGAASVTATVIPATMSLANLTLGQNLQTTARITLSAPSIAGATVTLTSNDSSRLLFSSDATTSGTGTLVMPIQAGRATSADFIVQALAGSGSVTYTASAPGYNLATGTVTLTPSGFVVFGPFGLAADFFTTANAANTDLTIVAGRLDSGLNFVESQQVRGGLSVNVPVTSSTLSVGTITLSPVVIAGGASSAVTQFDPATPGSTTLTAGTPPGFSSATQRSLAAIVRTAGINMEEGIAVGKNLQMVGTLLLGEPAPAGGAAVTVMSNSPNLRLSDSMLTAGTESIVINFAAGQSSASYYLHALSDSGTATYTASAPGYTSRTATAVLSPSGVVIEGPFGFGFPLIASLGGGDQRVILSTALLDPATNSFVMKQSLAAGLSLGVSLSSTNPAIGSIPSLVVIGGGTDGTAVQFSPLSIGQTTISVVTPGGYTMPANNRTLVARVQ